jgi:hypothetical protein
MSPILGGRAPATKVAGERAWPSWPEGNRRTSDKEPQNDEVKSVVRSSSSRLPSAVPCWIFRGSPLAGSQWRRNENGLPVRLDGQAACHHCLLKVPT